MTAPVEFANWKWIADPLFARTWGRWVAQLHVHTRAYALEHPERAARVRPWDALHDGILSGAPLHPDDVAARNDPTKFGVLHGDLNIGYRVM